MGSHWVLYLLYLNIVLIWPEDGQLRPKHVAKCNLLVIIASSLDVGCVLTVRNILYQKKKNIIFLKRDLLCAVNHSRDQQIHECILLMSLGLHCAYSTSSSLLHNYEYRNWQPGESAAQDHGPASHGQEPNTLLMRQNSPVFLQGLRCEIPLGPQSVPAHKFLLHIRVTWYIMQQRVYCSINLLSKSCISNLMCGWPCIVIQCG